VWLSWLVDYLKSEPYPPWIGRKLPLAQQLVEAGDIVRVLGVPNAERREVFEQEEQSEPPFL
jgi:hypothetical protein